MKQYVVIKMFDNVPRVLRIDDNYHKALGGLMEDIFKMCESDNDVKYTTPKYFSDNKTDLEVEVTIGKSKDAKKGKYMILSYNDYSDITSATISAGYKIVPTNDKSNYKINNNTFKLDGKLLL